MKPYAGNGLSIHQKVFNYRLSRARRVIENAFGLLAARWRIFRWAIKADPSTIDMIVKSTTCLHNYLIKKNKERYCPPGYTDHRNEMNGTWRQTIQNEGSCFNNFVRQGSNNYDRTSKQMRDDIAEYVNSDVGSLPWQLDYVTYSGKNKK
ncbi:uncharacterized protein LOC117101934 [Anneissia japonica]|uniref:uncharacterized protein LOC117101934 n=1 Tax=Anneissia japonica TaxID=1529436 RepID=UPI0014258B82|nr:uncharacterized protein LOC117101934 [Anneissia japonica]